LTERPGGQAMEGIGALTQGVENPSGNDCYKRA